MKINLVATVIAVVLIGSQAHAAPITVFPGDFLTFNFDLTGETPAPPYTLASMMTHVSGLDFAPPPCSGPGGLCELLDIAVWSLWTELNGTGTLFASGAANLEAQYHTEMTDGVFSATLQMTAGSITVNPVACGIARIPDGERTPDCIPAPPPPPAPEPAAISLLVSAAVAAVLCRRSRVPTGGHRE